MPGVLLGCSAFGAPKIPPHSKNTRSWFARFWIVATTHGRLFDNNNNNTFKQNVDHVQFSWHVESQRCYLGVSRATFGQSELRPGQQVTDSCRTSTRLGRRIQKYLSRTDGRNSDNNGGSSLTRAYCQIGSTSLAHAATVPAGPLKRQGEKHITCRFPPAHY